MMLGNRPSVSFGAAKRTDSLCSLDEHNKPKERKSLLGPNGLMPLSEVVAEDPSSPSESSSARSGQPSGIEMMLGVESPKKKLAVPAGALSVRRQRRLSSKTPSDNGSGSRGRA
jgi:hypothetical protein